MRRRECRVRPYYRNCGTGPWQLPKRTVPSPKRICVAAFVAMHCNAMLETPTPNPADRDLMMRPLECM